MASLPKRVAGGVIVRTSKRKATKTLAIDLHDNDGRTSSTSLLSSLNRKNNVQSISTIPRNDNMRNVNEFDSNDDDDDDLDIPSDAILCLRTYTGSGIVTFNKGGAGPGIGVMSETCAYCPIFGVNSNHDEALPVLCAAAPFLTRGVLLSALVGHDSHDESHSDRARNLISSRKRMQSEREIHNLLISDLVRPLHLQGISVAFGNEEDNDVALMEMKIYIDTSRMALEHHFNTSSSVMNSPKDLHDWFVSVLLPQYKGRTWFPSYDNLDKTMKCMILQLTHAGLLLPKRNGGCDNHNGYWFSLPGLGKAANSIEEGRATILQRLRSCPYNEKKRTALEHDIEQSIVERRAWRREREEGGRKKKKPLYSQSGKFVVMDMLAKGRVKIHVACTGEQFIRLAEEK